MCGRGAAERVSLYGRHRGPRGAKRREFVMYFMQRGVDGPVKIGHAVDVSARMRTHQTSNPEPLALLLVISGSRKREKVIHDSLAASRMAGEWFRPSQEVFAVMNALREPEYEVHNLKAIAVLRRRDTGCATTPCPYCGEPHHHGEGDGHRTAHCVNPTSLEVVTPNGTTLRHQDGYFLRSHGSAGPQA